MKPPTEVQELLQTLFRAISTSDLKSLLSVSLPDPDLYLLTEHKADAEFLSRLDDELENLQSHVLDRTETTMFCRAYFRGMLTPIALVKTADGWRANLRWWTAAAKPQHDSYRSARAFMFALMTADQEILDEVCVPTMGLSILIHGQSRPPGGEMGQYEHVASTLPVIELTTSDTFPSSGGRPMPVKPEWIGEDRKLLLVQYHEAEIALAARRSEDGKWRIDPTILIATIARRMQEANA